MINKLIKKQLDKLVIAKLPEYDSFNHSYTFKKVETIKLESGKGYLIRLDKSLLNSDDSNITLYNLNSGMFPKREYMKISVMKINSNLVNINGIYYDNETKKDIVEFWQGWLPINQIEVLEEI